MRFLFRPPRAPRRSRRLIPSKAAGGSDVTVGLTGVAATCAVGTLGVALSLALSGNAATGAAGNATASTSVASSGVSATGAAGTVGPAPSLALSGNAATGAAGTPTPSTTVALTGAGASGAVGSVTTGSDVTRALTGVAGTGSAGTLGPATSLALSGNASTGSLGSVGPSPSIALSGNGAAGSAGSVGSSRGVALSGSSASGSVGSVGASTTGDVTRALTGVSATGSVGNLTALDGSAPADSSAIDAALVAKLLADATLTALLPDGVFMDEAAPGAQRFVIVSLVDARDIATFDNGRTIEDALYLVKAVCLSTAGGNIKEACARIDALLEDGSLAVAGYTLMTMHREERLRMTEVDDVDPDVRWYHRGGRYRIQLALS